MEVVKGTQVFTEQTEETYVKSVIDFSFPEEYAVVGWFKWNSKIKVQIGQGH